MAVLWWICSFNLQISFSLWVRCVAWKNPRDQWWHHQQIWHIYSSHDSVLKKMFTPKWKLLSSLLTLVSFQSIRHLLIFKHKFKIFLWNLSDFHPSTENPGTYNLEGPKKGIMKLIYMNQAAKSRSSEEIQSDMNNLIFFSHWNTHFIWICFTAPTFLLGFIKISYFVINQSVLGWN